MTPETPTGTPTELTATETPETTATATEQMTSTATQPPTTTPEPTTPAPTNTAAPTTPPTETETPPATPGGTNTPVDTETPSGGDPTETETPEGGDATPTGTPEDPSPTMTPYNTPDPTFPPWPTDTQPPEPTSTPTVEITFERIWSDQFGGIEVNYLPGGSGKVDDFVLMGERANGLAYGAARFSLDPDTAQFRIWLEARLCAVGPAYFLDDQGQMVELPTPNGGYPIGVGSISGDEIFVHAGDIGRYVCQDFAIGIGTDVDEDGELQPGEVMSLSPWRFRIVTNQEYESSRAILLAGDWGGSLFTYADAFLGYFLGLSPPAQSSVGSTTFATSNHELDHNVGVLFNQAGVGSGSELMFDSSDQLTADIAVSPEIMAIINATLVHNRNEVNSYFDGPPGDGELIKGFEFPLVLDQVGFGFDSPDLFLALGGCPIQAHVIVVVENASRDVLSARLVGEITDIYDWNWGHGTFDRMAARVQAGYNTLGGAGKIFRTKIVLDNPIPGFVFSFN